MTDRVPGAPGQFQALVTAGALAKMQSGEAFPIILTRDDQPITEGTPYSKAAVLPDALAQKLCPGNPDPTPADALAALLPATHAADKDNPHGVTPAQIGAAIGNGDLPAGTDLNSVTASGMYRLNSPANCPDSCTYGQMVVIHGAGDTIAQIVFDHSGSRMFLRAGNPSDVGGQGEWTLWSEVYTTGYNKPRDSICRGYWENASPGSEFPAQTKWLDLSEFRFILLEYFLEGIAYPQYKFIGVGESTRIHDSHVHDTDGNLVLQDRQRDVTVNADSVVFGDGKYLSSNGTTLLTSNQSIKPYRIYGVF